MTDRSFLIWIVLPVLPLAAAFVVLGLVDYGTDRLAPLVTELPVSVADAAGEDGARETAPDGRAPTIFFDAEDGVEMRFFNAYATYMSVALFHLLACLAVIAVMVTRLAAMPARERRMGFTVALGALALVGLLSIAVQADALNGPLNLAYRHVCSVVLAAGVADHLLPESCSGRGLSRFAWLALLPYAFGVAAATFASAVTSTAFRPVAATAPEDVAAELDRRGQLVEQAFHATAFVLVTSTLSLVLFYKLPLAVIADPLAAELMTGFGQGMTLFWGVVFTLTLVAIFGPGLLGPHPLPKTVESAPTLPEALRPHAFRKRLAGILTTLAPLLIGASGSILEQLTAAL